MGKAGKITRRVFMGVGAAAAGGLAVGYYYYKKPYDNPLEALAAEGDAVFNPYVKIAADGTITIIAPRAEMGQGVQTTLAALVAEELEVELDQVLVEHGLPSAAYYNEAMMVEAGPYAFFDESFMAETTRRFMKVPAKFLALQVTGGSTAMPDGFVKMREAGAAARMVLLKAAAKRWDMDVEQLVAKNGAVHNQLNSETLSYGELAGEAALLSPPSKPKLKPQTEWKILGKSQNRVEGLEKVTGAPIYAIDVRLPEMLYGTVRISPRFGVGFKSYDTSATLAVDGVQDVVEIHTRYGIGLGVIANNTWSAFKGAEALEIEWEDALEPSNSNAISAALDDALARDPDFDLGGVGKPAKVLADAAEDTIISAEYEVPYLAHTTMEPMNATAMFKDGKLEIWAGTQGPGIVQKLCSQLIGIEPENTIVHTMIMGGGFGRRGEADFTLYATLLAEKTNGRPIKVTWTREEDTRHDTYRPVAKAKYQAVIAGNKIEAIDVKVATPSIMGSMMKRLYGTGKPPGAEKVLLDGSFDQPSEIEHKNFQAHIIDLPVPVGFWRSVGFSYNSFFYESFIDEAAHKAGVDPLEFRLSMMNEAEHFPAREVLKRVGEMSNWDKPLPAGKGRGIAHCLSFGTWVAQVIEVDVSDDAVKIERVFCAADPGIVLDPA